MCSVDGLVEQINTILDDHINTFKVINQYSNGKDQIKTYLVVDSYISILKSISVIKADNNISINFIKNIKNMIKLFRENQGMMKQLQEIVNNPKLQNKNDFCETLLTTMFIGCDNLDEIQQKYYQKDVKLTNKQEEPFSKYLQQLTDVQVKDKSLNNQVVGKITRGSKTKQNQINGDDKDLVDQVIQKQQSRKSTKKIEEAEESGAIEEIQKPQSKKKSSKKEMIEEVEEAEEPEIIEKIEKIEKVQKKKQQTVKRTKEVKDEISNQENEWKVKEPSSSKKRILYDEESNEK